MTPGKKFLLSIFLITCAQMLAAQDRPFWKEITAFKRQDSISMPPRKAILFVGSSSFAFWRNLQHDFPKHTVINRGFGGSGLPHVIDYADEIIYPYKPKQVVIYCGENDFYQGDNVTPQIVADRFKELFSRIREHLPRVHIAFISLKPSIRRQERMQEMAKANSLISDFLKNQKRATFINIYDDMLDGSGYPRKEFFIEDNLHLNASGYALWQNKIEPHLRKTKKPKLL